MEKSFHPVTGETVFLVTESQKRMIDTAIIFMKLNEPSRSNVSGLDG